MISNFPLNFVIYHSHTIHFLIKYIYIYAYVIDFYIFLFVVLTVRCTDTRHHNIKQAGLVTHITRVYYIYRCVFIIYTKLCMHVVHICLYLHIYTLKLCTHALYAQLTQ